MGDRVIPSSFFFFQAEDGIRDADVTGVQTCALPILETFQRWRELPAPKRGEYVRRLGNALREHVEELGALVTLEMGKILPEGIGEVQEMIDICDFSRSEERRVGKECRSEGSLEYIS